MALKAGRLFLVNITLNKDKEITGVFCGGLDEAHASGCAFAKRTAQVPVSEPFDIVLTTNSGYPLDLNLYQSVKGMSAAAQVVRPGGAIVMAAECRDGVPEHGLYGQLLKRAPNPPKRSWKISVHRTVRPAGPVAGSAAGHHPAESQGLRLQRRLERRTDPLSLLTPCRDIEATLAELVEQFGPQTRICVLPEGPQTIPYIE